MKRIEKIPSEKRRITTQEALVIKNGEADIINKLSRKDLMPLVYYFSPILLRYKEESGSISPLDAGGYAILAALVFKYNGTIRVSLLVEKAKQLGVKKAAAKLTILNKEGFCYPIATNLRAVRYPKPNDELYGRFENFFLTLNNN